MKTQKELQEAVDDLRTVCRKHGVVLIGTCDSEGIYGEITIGEARSDAFGWRGVERRLDNVVEGDEERGYCLGGIGDLAA